MLRRAFGGGYLGRDFYFILLIYIYIITGEQRLSSKVCHSDPFLPPFCLLKKKKKKFVIKSVPPSLHPIIFPGKLQDLKR